MQKQSVIEQVSCYQHQNSSKKLDTNSPPSEGCPQDGVVNDISVYIKKKYQLAHHPALQAPLQPKGI